MLFVAIDSSNYKIQFKIECKLARWVKLHVGKRLAK